MKNFLQKIPSNNILMFSILTLIGCLCCIVTKYENFFDFANYHYYNAFAFVQNRFNYDIVPNSVHAFFNPLPDLFLYYVIEFFNDDLILAYGLQGLWFGFLLFAFYKITTLFFDVKTLSGVIYSLLATVLAATGQMTWFQTGTSTNEIMMAFWCLSGLYLLLYIIKYPQRQSVVLFGIAGLILGSALGLKQTVFPICVAAGIGLITCYRHLNKPCIFICWFAFGGLLGFLLTDGWWMYKLYSLYGNPFFPFLNEFFGSPFFDNINYRDDRFIPPLKLAPFCPYLAMFSAYCNAETPFLEFRLPFFYTIGIIIVTVFVCRPKKLKSFYIKNPALFFLATFWIINYLLWMALFSILHYFVAGEMIIALFLIILISKYTPKSFFSTIFYYTFVCILLGSLMQTPYIYGSYGTRNGQSKMIDVEKIDLPDNTLIKLYNLPTAGVIPALTKGKNIKTLGYSQWFIESGFGKIQPMKSSDFAERGKFREIRDEIAKNHKGTEILVFRLPNMPQLQQAFIQNMAPDLEGKACRELKTSFTPIFGQKFYICLPPEINKQQ